MTNSESPSTDRTVGAAAWAAAEALPALLTPPAFWFPSRLVESAWLEHAPFAFWLVDALRPRVLVELGTHHGFSYLTFCEAIDRLGIDTRAYAIDHWRGDEHAGYFGSEVLDRLREYHDPRYRGFSRLIQSAFADAAPGFADGTVDLLHIDGLHTLAAVEDDFNTWLPKMSDRGVILFHDITVRQNGFEVWKVWERVSMQYPHFAFDHGHGLGVLGVGSEWPAQLGALFGFTEHGNAGAVRQAFARLGAAVTDRALLEQARAALTEAQGHTAGAEQRANTTHQQLAEAERRADTARRQAEKANDALATAMAEREQIEALLREITERVTALEASRGWRLPKPTRWVGHRARRILGRNRRAVGR